MDSNILPLLNLLAENAWMYNFQMTNYISQRIWERIPKEWITSFNQLDNTQLNDAPYNFKDQSNRPNYLPNNLKNFFQNSHELSAICDRKQIAKEPTTLPAEIKRGMNPKKQHEVSYMSSLVHELCQTHGVNDIVDVGAGLGYLGQVLCSQFEGYRVLGLESVSSRTHGADNMASKKAITSDRLMSATFELDDQEDSFVAFSTLLEEQFGKGEEHGESGNQGRNRVCMIGLHCCADLTPSMLKLFSENQDIQCMVCLGCCYHNMTVQEDGTYKNFPLSRSVQEAYQQVHRDHPGWQLCQYGLRLAAQETPARWKGQSEEDHRYHANNVAFRGLLELYCQQSGLRLHKTKRKVARKQDYMDFTTYISAVLSRVDLNKDVKDRTSEKGDDERTQSATGEPSNPSSNPTASSSSVQDTPFTPDTIRHGLEQLYTEHEAAVQAVEPLTCLQVALQPVLEALLLEDRRRYLLERGFHVQLVPVFDDFVSPRNVAIVAWKT